MRLVLESIEALSSAFAAHHQLRAPTAGAVVELGPEFAHGGFAAVHGVTSIDGVAPSIPLVAKVFDSGPLADVGGALAVTSTIAKLHTRLGSEGADWPARVLALTWALATITVGGKPTLLGLMMDLRPRGYAEPPFVESVTMPAYLARPVDERIELAISFAEKVALFERIGFIHGDLNPENMLVAQRTGDVQVIDFDCGAVVETGDERPLTPGKADECMPPEIKGIGAVGLSADVSRLTLEAERWSTGSGVGYWLLGAHPGFFLKAFSRPIIESYARHPSGWPEISPRDPNFLHENRRAYDAMRPILDDLPTGTRDCFRRFFAAGVDGARRPTAAAWLNALRDLQKPPEWARVEVDETWVLPGHPVRVSWDARYAGFVRIAGVDRKLPPAGSIEIPVCRAGRLRLRATNAHGSVDTETEVIVPVQPPEIGTIAVPAPPRVSLDLQVPRVEIGLDSRIVPPKDPILSTMTSAFFATAEVEDVPELNLRDALPEAPDLAGFFGATSPTNPRSR